MKKEEIKTNYDRVRANYCLLEAEAKFILEKEIEKKQIKTHTITSRIKTFDSFLKKVSDKSIAKPFDEVEDILGLRVVCLFRSDIDKIGKIIRKSFAVTREENKIEGYEITSFGYLSVHFILKMKNEYKGPRYDNIKNIKFEIQVRTLAMDAWATISHYLDYKSSIDVPKELRKDFFALSGLFYVADTHFEIFYDETMKARKKVNNLIRKEEPELEQDINMDTLNAYLQNKFPLREHADTDAISELVSELKQAGYSTIIEIDNKINNGEKLFAQYEKEDNCKDYYSDVGAARGSLYLIDDNLDKLSGPHENKAFEEFLKSHRSK